MPELLHHNHIRFRGFEDGCPACDKARSIQLPPPPEVHPDEPIIYDPLTASEFNAGCWTFDDTSFVETEEGEYLFAYGHLDREKFAATMHAWEQSMGADDWGPYPINKVEWRYAVLVTADRDDWQIQWDEKYANHPARFPVTVIDRG